MTAPHEDLLAWREEFPAVERTVFLGAHTLAPLSRRVRVATDRFFDAWQEKGSAERVWGEDILPEMRRLEGLYARLIGADAEEVVLTPSISTGLASIATSLDFDERTDVVLSRDEFPTDCHVWLAQERRGARLAWIDGRREDDYIRALGPSTAIVSASRVSYLDGAVLYPEGLIESCADAGALSLLDDYHGSGVVPIDVHALGVDVLVGGPLKYLLGGPGIAFLYVRRERIPSLRPAVTGWFSQRNFFAFDGSRLDWPDTAQRFALGTPAPASIFAAAAGLEIVLEVGVERIRERVSALTGALVEAATAAGYRVPTPADPARRGGLVSIEVPDSRVALEALLERNVICDQRHGSIRVSPHFYTSDEDLERFLSALRDVAPPAF